MIYLKSQHSASDVLLLIMRALSCFRRTATDVTLLALYEQKVLSNINNKHNQHLKQIIFINFAKLIHVYMFCWEEMQKNRLLYLILLLSSLFPSNSVIAEAQNDVYQPKMLIFENLSNEDILRSFQKRFGEIDSMLANSVSVASPTMRSVDMTAINSRLDSLYDARSRHEAFAYMSRNGLELTGQLYGRLDNIAKLRNDNDEEEDISRYWAKFQAELGWNIFNSRFYNRDASLRKILLDNELGRIRSKKEMRKDIFDELAHRLTERYNYYLGIVQYQRLMNIDLLNEAYQLMLEKDRIANDRMLEVMNEKMQMEYELSQTFDVEGLGYEPLYVVLPTVLLTDTTSLWLEMQNRNADLRENVIKEESLKNQIALTTYASTMRVSPFARLSSYFTSNKDFSHNIDLGVRFTFPLYNESPKKRQALRAEIGILEATRETLTAENQSRCRMHIARIERLNKAIKNERLHISQLGKYIDIRRNAYKNSRNGYNYIARMEEYNEYLKSMERMYKLMLQRSLTVVDIQKTTGIINLDGIINEIKL